MGRKVCVAGYGAVTPYGRNAVASFLGLLQGQSVYQTAVSLDLSDRYFTQKQIAEVTHEQTASRKLPQTLHPQAHATRLTILAMQEALDRAALPLDRLHPLRVGIALSTVESHALEDIATVPQDALVVPDEALMALADPEYCLRAVRELTGISGPGMVLSNACASGNHAIAAGVDLIRSGEVDVAIVGGACKTFKSAMVGFHQFQGISQDTCRPFSGNRSGVMLGDGAGILVLESQEHATSRGLHPEIIIPGYGTSCDAYDMMAPHPEGVGMKLAMQRALENSGLQPEDIQYINAHGTGTLQNDRLETLSIRSVFGSHATQLMVSSTKSLHGHTLLAASAVEAVWCCLVLEQGQVPPTINYECPDPECDLDYVVNRSRTAHVTQCMNNSFGFGGSNASVIFSKAG